MVAPDRQVVVGIKPTDKTRRLRSGAHVIPKGQTPGPDNDQGYVTSVCFSPMLDQWIGLGLVEREKNALLVTDLERLAEMVHAAAGE